MRHRAIFPFGPDELVERKAALEIVRNEFGNKAVWLTISLDDALDRVAEHEHR